MAAGIAGREKRHSFKDRGDDYYPSLREAVDALIRLERPYLPQRLWEPACGDGAIVRPFREAGYTVHATDLVARGCPDSESGVDFLLPVVVPEDIGGVVTNPPFKFARQFVDKALGFSPYVAMLLRLSFLEGSARRPWFESSPLARVHVSSKRLPMMHRGGWDGPTASSAIAFAWFVWDRRHEGRPHIHWFDHRDYAQEAANDVG